ncbi:GDSL esterase/lipase EXL3-like [Camellia sinensis]|uniref:GDSL esterase/lipase EXL3-like n=1 Tax=Camellia sinensis TaxID=4442 RepID=UPI001036C768|nr:GDSL esterase/lipase EXL3-like [Camellia sinensis]
MGVVLTIHGAVGAYDLIGGGLLRGEARTLAELGGDMSRSGEPSRVGDRTSRDRERHQSPCRRSRLPRRNKQLQGIPPQPDSGRESNATPRPLSFAVFVGNRPMTDANSIVRDPNIAVDQYDINSYTNLVVNYASDFVKELYLLGAKKIGLFGAAPIGCLPSQRTLAGGELRVCSEIYNQAAQLMNSKLSSAITSYNNSLNDPKARIVYTDIYNPLLNIILNHDKYGFSVADKGCCGTGNLEVSILCNQLTDTCPDDSVYVFWDSYHPTERGYRVLVNQILQSSLNKFF